MDQWLHNHRNLFDVIANACPNIRSSYWRMQISRHWCSPEFHSLLLTIAWFTPKHDQLRSCTILDFVNSWTVVNLLPSGRKLALTPKAMGDQHQKCRIGQVIKVTCDRTTVDLRALGPRISFASLSAWTRALAVSMSCVEQTSNN